MIEPDCQNMQHVQVDVYKGAHSGFVGSVDHWNGLITPGRGHRVLYNFYAEDRLTLLNKMIAYMESLKTNPKFIEAEVKT